MNKANQTKVIIIIYIILSLAFTIFFLGFENLSPYAYEWLLASGDITQHYLGWCNFKNDVWRFPIGLNPNFGGINNSIVYTDSIPLFAFIFKFVKVFFRENFSYFSIWVYFCFFLQLFFSYKLIYFFSKNITFSFICSLFFLTAPVFLFKSAHVLAHAAHFLILASFLLFETKKNINRKIYFWLFLSFLSILINFYFFYMISIIFVIDLLKSFFDEKKFFKIIKLFLTYIIFSFLIMYLSGYFSINSINTVAKGFGYFKFNLLGFFDPIQIVNNSEKNLLGFTTWSLLVKDLPSFAGEYEGFSYLGLGIILLLILALFNYFKQITKKKNFFCINYLFFIFIIFVIIALSTKIDLGHINILTIENFYVNSALGIARAGGRFIWPAYYLIFIFVLINIFKNYKNKFSILIVSLALIIQIIDTLPGLKQINNQKIKGKKSILNINTKDPLWNKIKEEKKLIYTYEINENPMLYKIGNFTCENKINTNIFYLARYDRFLTPKNRYDIYDKIYLDNLDNSPYLISSQFNHILDIKDRYKNKKLGLFNLDGLWLAKNKEEFLMRENDRLELEKIDFPLIYENQIIDGKYVSFFGLGWMKDENNKNFLWSDGNISTVLLKVKNNDKNKILKFKINSKQINDEEINFEIYINDIFFKTEKIIQDKSEIFIIELSKLKFNELEKYTNLRIDFRFNDILSEYEKFSNINGNKRAFKLENIVLN